MTGISPSLASLSNCRTRSIILVGRITTEVRKHIRLASVCALSYRRTFNFLGIQRMRLLILFLILIGTPASADLSRPTPATKLEEAANNERFANCFRGKPGPKRNKVGVLVTIGLDGMIIGEPIILDPKDTDEFREDVKITLEKVKACQPYKFYPPEKFQTVVQVPFYFEAPGKGLPDALRKLIGQHFLTCYTIPRNGPPVTLYLTYHRDGTLNGPPRLSYRLDDPEYLRTAADTIEQITKCTPAEWPIEIYEEWQSFQWTFQSLNGRSR